MIIRSKAPLRLGLAGGGTDVSPYSDDYGGAILNSTINLHVYTSIEPTNDNYIHLHSLDLGVEKKFKSEKSLTDTEGLSLPIGVYNRLIKDYDLEAKSFKLTTYVDVPKGSGLGTSSTITVSNLILYYTGTSRLSASIIEKQSSAFKQKTTKSVEAAHKIKQQAISMKQALLTGDIDAIGRILDEGWQFKKEMAAGITNEVIDNIYSTAQRAGAIGGKISGAGGGGYMTLYCPGNTRHNVSRELESLGGRVQPFSFDPIGLTTWTKQ